MDGNNNESPRHGGMIYSMNGAKARAMLQHLHVKFEGAKSTPRRGPDRMLYSYKISNTATGKGYRVSRCFRRFRELQLRLLETLDNGHECRASCPYIYSWISSSFPRQHLFRYNWVSVIDERTKGLQQFFDRLIKTALNTSATANCSIAQELFPMVIVEFLLTGIDVQKFMEADEIVMLEKKDSSRLSIESLTSDSLLDCNCEICEQPLCPDDKPEETSHTSDHLSRRSSRGCGVTTIACGHMFHDECIVAKLNEQLTCPTCDKKMHPVYQSSSPRQKTNDNNNNKHN